MDHNKNFKTLKIGYFADGPWSHRSFLKIISNKQLIISFIVPRQNTKDKTLKKFCKEYEIDYLPNSNVNSEKFIKQIIEYNVDLFVSMSFNQIFKKNIISIPKLGVINCHAGKLPFYRGRNVLNWVLINGEKNFGITVHYIDENIDTGDIIEQRIFPISEDDNYSTILETAYKNCPLILYESILKILNNNVKTTKQNDIHHKGSYCRKRKVGDEIINWNQSSKQIFNFIRAICKPGPIATTFLNKDKVLINSSKVLKCNSKKLKNPGKILEKTKDGFIVETKDGILEIREIESKAEIKINSTFN